MEERTDVNIAKGWTKVGHIQGLPGVLRSIMILLYEIHEMDKHENCRQGREIFTSFSFRGHGSGDQVQERNATDHDEEKRRASEMTHVRSLREISTGMEEKE